MELRKGYLSRVVRVRIIKPLLELRVSERVLRVQQQLADEGGACLEFAKVNRAIAVLVNHLEGLPDPILRHRHPAILGQAGFVTPSTRSAIVPRRPLVTLMVTLPARAAVVHESIRAQPAHVIMTDRAVSIQ